MRYKPVNAGFLSQKIRFAFSSTRLVVFFRRVLWLNDIGLHPTARVLTNRNVPVRNTLVQLLALYTDPESYSAQRYSRTDKRTTWWQ